MPTCSSYQLLCSVPEVYYKIARLEGVPSRAVETQERDGSEDHRSGET
jgi:hypothetical protein